MSSLNALRTLNNGLPDSDVLQPVLFIGHGSPMNGIEHNVFSREWQALGRRMTRPTAVLVVSAHWLTKGTHVTAMDFPRTIHDFGGFPKELYEVQYPAPGSPAIAQATAEVITSASVELDHEWGLDHGAWTVVRHLFPEATVPVLQLSIDYSQPMRYHYELASELAALRKKGVLIMGSGNMVHNLRMVAWDKLDVPGFGYDWAHGMNEKFKQLIASSAHDQLLHYESLGPEARLAIPTPDHYIPLIYALGAAGPSAPVSFFNDYALAGSLTMTSVRFG